MSKCDTFVIVHCISRFGSVSLYMRAFRAANHDVGFFENFEVIPMHIRLQNIGLIEDGEFDLGDLTILCGENNSGKTYTAYSFYGFLHYWHSGAFRYDFGLDEEFLAGELLEKGMVRIRLDDAVEKLQKNIAVACQNYQAQLAVQFAAPSERFKESRFKLTLREESIREPKMIAYSYNLPEKGSIEVTKPSDSPYLEMRISNTSKGLALKSRLQFAIRHCIKDAVSGQYLPFPFMVGTARTGSVLLSEEIRRLRMHVDFPVPPTECPYPVSDNLETIRNASRNIAAEVPYPEILDEFADILGGRFEWSENTWYFIPYGGSGARLTLREGSSSVSSLLLLAIFLTQGPGEDSQGISTRMLMIDEPELNQHPKNQTRLARLFARLVNRGVKVFITTHSDYFIREFNTLLLLNREVPRIKTIMKQEGYIEEELLSAHQLKVYSIRREKSKSGAFSGVIDPCEIDQDVGIAVESFDQEIDRSKRIQEEIMFG